MKPHRALALIGLLLLSGLAALTPNAAAATQYSGSDDFEAWDVGLLPGTAHDGVTDLYTYTPATANDAIVTTPVHAGTKSLATTVTGGVSGFLFQFHGSFCNSSKITFWFRIPSALTNVNHFFNLFSTGTGSSSIILRLDQTTGSVRITNGNQAAVNGNNIPGWDPAPDTWYHATITGSACGDPNTTRGVCSGTVSIEGFGGSSVPTNLCTTAGNPGDFSKFSFSCSGACNAPIIDDLEATTIVQFVSAESTSPSYLVGMAVSPFNAIMTTRTGPHATPTCSSGDCSTITNRDPTNFASGNVATGGNKCDTQEGVMNLQGSNGNTYVGFVDCNTQGVTTNTLKIRNFGLTNPNVEGTACQAHTNLCTFQLQSDEDTAGVALGLDQCPGSSAYAFPANTAYVGGLQSMPINFKASTEDGQSGDPTALIGMAYFNSNNGNLGVFADLQRDGSVADKSCGLEVQFSSNTANHKICTWGDYGSDASYFQTKGKTSTLDFIAGASSLGQSRIWQVQIDPHLGAAIRTAPEVTITVAKQLPNPYNALTDIACAARGTKVLVTTTGGELALLNFTGAVHVDWSKTSAGSPKTSALSADGCWFAYTDAAGNLNVGNATSGILTGSGALSSGFNYANGESRFLFLDDTGQTAYTGARTATGGTSLIQRFDVHQATTITPRAVGTRYTKGCLGGEEYGVYADGTLVDPEGPGKAIENPDSTSTASGQPQGILGLDASRFDLTGNGDSTIGGLFMTVLWVLAFAAIGATIIPTSTNGRIWGAGLAAVLGFVIFVWMGNVPPLITFLIVLLATAAIGFRIRAGHTAGD